MLFLHRAKCVTCWLASIFFFFIPVFIYEISVTSGIFHSTSSNSSSTTTTLSIFHVFLQVNVSNKNETKSNGLAVRTSIQCDDGDCCSSIFINRSCLYSNLYFSNSAFSMFLHQSDSVNITFKSHSVESGIRHPPEYDWIHPHFYPTPRYFNDETLLQNLSDTFQFRPGIFLILSGAPHGNWAHAILDNLYSIWLVACKFNLDSRSQFTAVILGSTSPESLVHENFRVFLGGLEFVSNWPADAKYRLELVAAGTGQMGLSTPGTDYVMPGRKYDALKKMRARFYIKYRVTVPLARLSSMEEGTKNHDTAWNVLFVPNKRDYNGVLSSEMQALVNAFGYTFTWLDWALPFVDRLDIIRKAHIGVTGVGTGACNLFLLSDGTVVVNLGTRERSGSMSFQEEYLFAAMYWVRVVYPTYEQYMRMSPQVAIELIHRGKDMILSNFDSSPHAAGEVNFSPIGKAGSHYFRNDLKAWGAFVGSYVHNPSSGYDIDCLNMVERLLCRTGPWGNNRCSDTNQSLILDLLSQYDIRCPQ